ncbi:MAG: GNAT family N-acetyltransferase [Pseudomonadota bacterium]
MTLRPASDADIPAMERFLATYAETSMFLRSNLASHGLHEMRHPHGTRFWVFGSDSEKPDPAAPDSPAALSGVFGATNGGFLMLQAPGIDPRVFVDWAAALKGHLFRGITGDDPQVRRALAALRLRSDLFRTNHAEPLYRLELDRLDAPEETMRPALPEDHAMLTDWYTNYLIDTGLTDDLTEAREEGAARAVAAAKPGAERLLIENGRPVAAASINAQVEDMVQLGGVFVPKQARNKGLARRVTAARLAEARKAGARVAILFANNAAAARAYEAIGFRRIGAYRVALLKSSQLIGGG